MKKKLKIAGVILASLFSATTFAAGSTVLKFDLSNKDAADAQGEQHYFHCDVAQDSKDYGNVFNPTIITFTISGDSVIFEQGGDSLNKVSINDLKTKYFNVKKGSQQGESTVSYSTNNETKLSCDKTKGGRGEEYTGQ